MTDTTQIEAAPETPAPAEAPETEQPAPEGGEQSGTPEERGHVDFRTAPPELVEARFNRLYRQVKETEASKREMAQHLRALHDRLAELETGQRTERLSGQREKVTTDLRDAMEKGDTDRAIQLQRELVEIEVNARTTAPAKATPAPVETQQPPSGNEAWVPPEELEAINAWAKERPFARGGDYQKWTAAQVYDLYSDPEWEARPITDKLAEVDRRYKVKTRPAGASVLAPNGDQRPPQRKPNGLTGDEKKVAWMIFPDKSKADAEAEYARGKAR